MLDLPFLFLKLLPLIGCTKFCSCSTKEFRMPHELHVFMLHLDLEFGANLCGHGFCSSTDDSHLGRERFDFRFQLVDIMSYDCMSSVLRALLGGTQALPRSSLSNNRSNDPTDLGSSCPIPVYPILQKRHFENCRAIDV